MKIKKISYWEEKFELSRPYTITFRTVSYVSNYIIKIETLNGEYGLGCASPEPFVTGEEPLNCESFLKMMTEVPTLFEEWNSPWQLIHKFNLIYLKIHAPAAKAAIEMSILDLYCKLNKISIGKFLDLKIPFLPTSITVGIKTLEETISESREYVQRGFKHLKIKLGKNLSEDIEKLIKLRELLPSNINIRVDINQGYSLEDYRYFLEKTNEIDLEFIEQPFSKEKPFLYESLTSIQRKNIAMDESLQKKEDALFFIQTKRKSGIFNIKLMKCGGPSEAIKIALLANENQISLMWGCMDESKISISMALNLGLSCSNTKYLDLDGSFDLGRDIVNGGYKLIGENMYPLDLPGLGVDLI